jgi:hypothetical protein
VIIHFVAARLSRHCEAFEMSRAKLPAETVIKPCVAAADEYTHSGHLTAGVARKSNEAFTSHAAYREGKPRAGKVAVTGGIRPTTTKTDEQPRRQGLCGRASSRQEAVQFT